MALSTTVTIKDGSGVTNVVTGADVVFTNDGQGANGSVHLQALADNYLTSRGLTLRFKRAVLNAARSGYGKQKSSISYVIPHLDSSNILSFGVVRIELEATLEQITASGQDLLDNALALCNSTDIKAFMLTGAR